MAKKGGRGKGRGAVMGGGAAVPSAAAAADKSKNQNQTIVLLATGGADPWNPLFAAAGKNKVRWDNQAERGLTLYFSHWPFVEAPVDIAIEAGRKSKWFTVVPNVVKGKYNYVISPDLTSGEPGPDPPGVSFNG